MLSAWVPAYIPSPPANGISIGPLRLHVYGLLIACGVLAAVWLAQRRWERIGGKPGTMASLAIWGVPGGLIGARAYSLATSWQVDTGGHWYQGFEIWRGGLGIWGGIAGGVALGAVGAHRAGLSLKPLLDATAPGFALAQAIGRWGNYFNQELFGRPTKLPWGLEISPQNRPPGYAQYATFQPTFLYECLWDLIVVGLLIWTERRFRIKRGYLVAAYASFYTFGRFWTEYLRIDTAHRFGGLRLNDWTSIAVFVVSTAILLIWGRAGPQDERAGDPLPQPAGEEPEPRQAADAVVAGAGSPDQAVAVSPSEPPAGGPT